MIKRQGSMFLYFFIIILPILIVSCFDKKVVTPQISDIKLKTQRARVGMNTEVFVDILSNPSNLILNFEWRTSNGNIEQGSPSVKYQPEKEGNSVINLNVKNIKNNELVATRELSFHVYPAVTPVDVITDLVFAGFMGDGERFGEKAIILNDRCEENPQSPPSCVKFTYRILPDSVGWAGVYAQYNVRGEGNWGDHPGMNLSGYNRIVFYAKGKQGGEMVEFKAGGIDTPGKPYRDSFEYSMGTVKLNKEWTRYEMDLTGENLSSVIGGFCWVATARSNPKGLTFYVDSITYE